MPAGQKLGAKAPQTFVRLIVIHPSGSGGVGTGDWQLVDKAKRVPNAE